MALIENSSEIPEVTEDFHTLAIEFVDLVEGTKYGEPDVPEIRIKMQLRVETPGEEQQRFAVWMSTNTGERATFGSIVRAALGGIPRGGVETDDLIGKKFRSMVTHNDAGWPKLVPGTAAPMTTKKGKTLVAAEAVSTEEPPF
jgi:hypothetical protein